jgi:hypothetical protein
MGSPVGAWAPDVSGDGNAASVDGWAKLDWHDFGGRQIPFLGCSDLAVFKVFYNRTKDWADLEEMIAIGRSTSIRPSAYWCAISERVTNAWRGSGR